MLETEKRDIINNFRALGQENQRIKTTAEQLETERSTYRVELGALRDQIARRDATLREQEKVVSQHLTTCQALERQNQHLQRDL